VIWLKSQNPFHVNVINQNVFNYIVNAFQKEFFAKKENVVAIVVEISNSLKTGFKNLVKLFLKEIQKHLLINYKLSVILRLKKVWLIKKVIII
jgi:hypothetical protein